MCKILAAASFLALAFFSGNAVAEPPQLQTSAPVIFLADNLDEQDKLGWCIDTQGRGFSERLHAHSCKPQGGDVQFLYDAGSSQIKSATFSGKCATLDVAPKAGIKFGLLDCKTDAANQKFTFNSSSGEFHPARDNNLCLVVGSSSRSAGPFMSRNLELASCASTAPKFKKWVYRTK